MITFQSMGLPEALCHTLLKMQFTKPTPIQEKAIPLALEGKDILGSAKTGTGKTGAFGIPVIAKLLSDPSGKALIMTPTRELATQVIKQLRDMLGERSPIRSALLIGGDSIVKQLRQLDKNPRLVVGTPGRINDFLERKKLNLNDVKFLILDETDRMLDMGFVEQIENIMDHIKVPHQTLLFSATLPRNIVNISKKYLNNPIQVGIEDTSEPAANLKQDTLRIRDNEKYPTLLTQLDERDGSIIIFVKTKIGTEKMAEKLSRAGHSADAIHGDLRQNKRDRVIQGFRKKRYRILVATDVAARGLDIPHIEHVINYDLPQCAEDYIHRIGRTARAGATGSSLAFITPADGGKWHAINRLLNPNSKESSPRSGNKGRRFSSGKGGYTASKGKPRSSYGKKFGTHSKEGSSTASGPRRSKPRTTVRKKTVNKDG